MFCHIHYIDQKISHGIFNVLIYVWTFFFLIMAVLPLNFSLQLYRDMFKMVFSQTIPYSEWVVPWLTKSALTEVCSEVHDFTEGGCGASWPASAQWCFYLGILLLLPAPRAEPSCLGTSGNRPWSCTLLWKWRPVSRDIFWDDNIKDILPL